jgi:multiple sugar transport system substrate-binding protein
MGSGLPRRKLLQLAGAAGLGTALGLGRRVYGQGKRQLRILQWNHFVPGYDTWFNGPFIHKWGEENDTQVVVDNVGVTSINSLAAAEVSAGKGHDLFNSPWPRAVYENDVIDHRPVYEACEKRYGRPVDLALKSTFNPRTGRYPGFCDSYAPDPVNYRKDLWDEAGMAPDTWDDVRVGGAKIKQKTGIPVGIGLSSEPDTAMAMRAILHSFGGSVQDAEGNLVLDSRATLEAVKFVKALYTEAMTPEVLAWDPSSNNRAMLAGRSSLVLNAISVTRTAEKEKLPIGEKIWLARAPKGPVRRQGVEHFISIYAVWRFAPNVEGAKKFLVDFVGHSREAFLASESYNLPSFPKQIPDLAALLANDPKAKPPDKYAVLAEALEWTTNVGYPGHATAAEDEVYGTWVLNSMFASAATGADSPESAVKTATQRCRKIWEKWKERKLI